jgi:hydroxypyruvate isomerase
MPKLAANLSTLFQDLSFLDRFAAAAKAGFQYVEYQFPYAWEAGEVAAAAREAGLSVVLHNFPQGDSERGDRGIACHPGREAQFREHLERAVHYAKAVGCRKLHCLAGIVPEGVPTDRLEKMFVSNLQSAARRLAGQGLQLLVEPISQRSVPGYLLSHSAHALRILDAVGAENAALQYDVFHMQVMEGDLASTIERLLPRIGHVQIADVPGRHEPGTGEINFEFILDHLDRIGYSGWVGCEYNPKGDTHEGLEWAKRYLKQR